MKPKQLQYGETPWDDLSREDLLREVWRLWIALNSLHGLVRMDLYTECARAGIPLDQTSDTPGLSPFWGKEGRGGAALEMARQVIQPVYDRFDWESVYHAFFRYAPDLLFESNGYLSVCVGWVVCSECGVMYGSQTGDLMGHTCGRYPGGTPGCQGVFRRLTWEDLKPRAKSAAPDSV